MSLCPLHLYEDSGWSGASEKRRMCAGDLHVHKTYAELIFSVFHGAEAAVY